jgi:hypothetical protein
MEVVAITVAIILGCYIIAKAIKEKVIVPPASEKLDADSEKKQKETEVVSNIAATLIAGVLANPKYWEREENNYATLMNAKTDNQIDWAKERIEKESVFGDEGRKAYIELAYKIYNTIRLDL